MGLILKAILLFMMIATSVATATTSVFSYDVPKKYQVKRLKAASIVSNVNLLAWTALDLAIATLFELYLLA